MSDVDVVIVIVSYKSASLTIDCLHSIARERSVGSVSLACVVVDNASGDAPTIEAEVTATGWAWVKVLTAERNGGFAYGNNLGVREALLHWKPRYVHLLNPDTVLRPRAVETLVAFLDGRPTVGIAGGIFENADETVWSIAFRFPSASSEFAQGLEFSVFERWVPSSRMAMDMGMEAAAVDWVSGASMMVRREVLEEIGGLDEGFFLYFEETEFCHRAKQAGHGVWYVPQSRVIHIAGQSTRVTERNVALRRLPAYWFESRRRYFLLTHGVVYAMAVDLLSSIGHAVGGLKRRLQGRPDSKAPYFLRDLIGASLVWPSNRRAEPGHRVVPRF